MRKFIFIIIVLTINIIHSQDITDTSNSFIPESGKYITTGWVKEIHSQQVISYTSYINVIVSGISTPVNVLLYPKGNIIDGWQRIIGIVDIPDVGNFDKAKLEILLNCSNVSEGECYFDDIRFYPFNGNMKSFVYDENTQRLMAELDENNYATFYEYDLEGGLIRVKKETERGVYTIQETRSNNPKKE